MGRIAKRPQYDAFNRRHNCFGRFQEHDFSLEAWRQSARPLMLEIGAGTAAIATGFSLDHPAWQIIAVDRKSDRLNKAARRESLANLVFLQAELQDLLDMIDLRGQVELIWLAFPDPYPGSRRAGKRLTHPSSLQIYKQLLAPGGRIRFKTDARPLFEYTREVLESDLEFEIIKAVEDLKGEGYEKQEPDVGTITTYERKFLEAGLVINYLEARFIPDASGQ